MSALVCPKNRGLLSQTAFVAYRIWSRQHQIWSHVYRIRYRRHSPPIDSSHAEVG
jgi:hypothetical protein